MCKVRSQHVLDFFILNVKDSGRIGCRAYLKGRGSQQQQPANFRNQVPIRISCRQFINACRNLAESFCFSKKLFENQCARDLFKILAHFFSKMGHFSVILKDLGLIFGVA